MPGGLFVDAADDLLFITKANPQILHGSYNQGAGLLAGEFAEANLLGEIVER